MRITGIKVAWAGLALTALGLGFFLPQVEIVGAVVLIIGAVLIAVDR